MFDELFLDTIVTNEDLYEADNNNGLPKFQYDGMSSAVDLRANIPEKLVLQPNQTVLIPVGLRYDMTHHECTYTDQVGTKFEFQLSKALSLCALVLPRSGLGHKGLVGGFAAEGLEQNHEDKNFEGLVCGNLVGLIDQNYQGEIRLSAWNRSGEAIIIEPADRICQLMWMLAIRPTQRKVDAFRGETSRGEGGYNSSGQK